MNRLLEEIFHKGYCVGMEIGGGTTKPEKVRYFENLRVKDVGK